MPNIYIADGKRFIWRILVEPHLIDEIKKCKNCGGRGELSGFGFIESEMCQVCNGRGTERWYSPMFNEPEIVNYLQKCLDKRLNEEIEFKKNNPPFIGMGI